MHCGAKSAEVRVVVMVVLVPAPQSKNVCRFELDSSGPQPDVCDKQS